MLPFSVDGLFVCPISSGAGTTHIMHSVANATNGARLVTARVSSLDRQRSAKGYKQRVCLSAKGHVSTRASRAVVMSISPDEVVQAEQVTLATLTGTLLCALHDRNCFCVSQQPAT